MKVIIAMLVAASLLAGCGSPEEPEARQSPDEIAYEYGLERSGGETEGCSTAKAGPESERDPGCIFAVAFSGCLDALEGSSGAIDKAVAIRDEFPKEPKLWDIYDQAVDDCSEG